MSAVAGVGDVGVAGSWGGGLLLHDTGGRWLEVPGGPVTDYVYDVYVRDSLVFVGTEGEGVHCYDVRARRWRAERHGLGRSHVFCLGGAPAVMLAGTWQEGLFRSRDEGKSWRRSVDGLGRGVVYCIGTQGDTVLVGTARRGLFASYDSGASWISIGLHGMSVTSVAVLEGVMVAGTWKRGLFRREPGDTNWVSVDEPAESLRDLLVVDGKLYAAKRTVGVYGSDDGVRWRPVDVSGYDPYSLGRWQDKLVVGTWGGGVRSIEPDDAVGASRLRDSWQHLVQAGDGGVTVHESGAGDSPSEEEVLLSGLSNEGRILSARFCDRGKLVVCYELEEEGSMALSVFSGEGRMMTRETVMAPNAGRQYTVSIEVRGWKAGVYVVTMRTRRDYERVYAVVTDGG